MSAAYASQLSLRAIRHRPLPTLVSALGLAAVLAPLLILYGLKSGIVSGLVETLRSDPTILRVQLTGAVSLTDADIEALRARPETGFVVGAPSTLAARMEMTSAARGMDIERSDWLPSGPGDPLLPPGVALRENEIALAEPLAERLGVGPADKIEAFAYRNNEAEMLTLTLTVAALLPRQQLEPGQGNLGLVHPRIMDIRDAFQGNFEVPDYGIGGKPLSGRTPAYSSVRLYASSLDQVVALDRIMAELGFRAESKAANIAWVESLDMVMAGVFGIISSAGVIGFGLSLWANVTSNLQQYRGQLSLLRLLGLGEAALSVFPLVQVLAIVTLGLLLSGVAAALVATVINRLYLTDMFEGRICQIEAVHVLTASFIAYAIAFVVAVWQSRALRSITPSEALAENV